MKPAPYSQQYSENAETTMRILNHNAAVARDRHGNVANDVIMAARSLLLVSHRSFQTMPSFDPEPSVLPEPALLQAIRTQYDNHVEQREGFTTDSNSSEGTNESSDDLESSDDFESSTSSSESSVTWQADNSSDTSYTPEPSTSRSRTAVRAKQGKCPPITYPGSNATQFKSQFMTHKKAEVTIFTKGTREPQIKIWQCKRFTETSNLAGNIRSRYCRKWEDNGIIKLEVRVIKPVT